MRRLEFSDVTDSLKNKSEAVYSTAGDLSCFFPDTCDSFQCFRTRSSSGWKQRHVNGLHTHLSTSHRTSTSLAQVLMPKMFSLEENHCLCDITLILESQIVHGLPKMPGNVHGVPKYFLLMK